MGNVHSAYRDVETIVITAESFLGDKNFVGYFVSFITIVILSAGGRCLFG